MEDRSEHNKENVPEQVVADGAVETARVAKNARNVESNDAGVGFTKLADAPNAVHQEENAPSECESEYSLETRAAMDETEAILELKMMEQEEADEEKYERLNEAGEYGDEQNEDAEDEEVAEVEAEEDEEEEEEEVPSMEDARRELCEAIDSVQGAGTFASSGAIPYLPDPCITLGGGGWPIMLPLNEYDGQRIVNASHQASFASGHETTVDQAVWQLDHTQFAFHNPGFQIAVNTTLTQVVKDLGLEGQAPVQALPNKLLLYQPGAVFGPHTE